jgi:CHAD domain-containing protein
MTEPNFLLEALDRRWEQYRTDLRVCRAEFSEEAVHDLRVDTRRLLSVLEIIRFIDPNPGVQKLRRVFKKQLDDFDDLRDVQVMLADISENIESLSELAPFQQYLQKQEKRLLRTAEAGVRAIKPTSMNHRLLKVREVLSAIPAEGLPLRLLQTVDNAYLIVRQRYGWIDPDQPASIHSVRVAFKKFRYMIECIHPVLTDFPEAQFKRMHDYQTMMGDIQDAEVFLLTLANFATRHTEFALDPVHRLYERYFSQALTIYLDDKGELETFWRATPETAFPWNMKPKNEELT